MVISSILSSRNRFRPDHTSRSGSALVLTLMVVSLMLVMVISFVVFVRMELRQVVNQQNLLQARANARLGANLAVARLQEIAGADTRITAPIQPDSSTRPNQLLIGQAVDAAPYLPDGPNSVRYNTTYGQTLGYFLSADESAGFDPLSYWPFDGDGNPTTGNALLVGPGSVSDVDANGDGVPDDYVAAPIEEITSGNEGAFAWWISDEGLKAQINVTDPYLADTGTLDDRAQVATAQRMGSERVLENYDPSNDTHNEILSRSYNMEQLNLIEGFELGPDVVRDYYHDVTLQSLGLPTNTRRGGMKRDLTPVFQEVESNSGGVVNPSGDQWTQLIANQRERLDRWRAETVALEGLGTQPSNLADRHWNAMSAITLRQDQADHRLDENIFPPMSDLVTTYDPGGPLWRQLLTWPTLRQRRGNGTSVQASRPWRGNGDLENLEVNPVVARINLSTYYTLDWPDGSLHFVPYVVMWNPYTVPLRAPNNGWHVKLEYDAQVFLNDSHRYPFSLKVKNANWSPDSTRYPHIVDDWLWTPRMTIGYRPRNQYSNQGTFLFRLTRSNGDTDLVIPPGEAVMFTMHEHHQVSSSRSDSSYKSYGIPDGTYIDLQPGVPADGLYSFYVTEDLNYQVIESAKNSGHGYMGGVTAWDHNRTSRTDPNSGVTTLESSEGR